MLFEEEPLMIRGKGQGIKNTSTLLDERLLRCDLELSRVLRLDDQINIFEVDFKNLRSIFLEKNVNFKALVDELKIWNEDVKQHKENKKPIVRAGYRYNLIKYLAQNLREVVNTKDRQIQLFYLMQLKNWYDRQNGILSSFRPSTQGGRLSTASRPGTSYQNNQYSSNVLREKDQVFFPTSNMDDYQNQHRSKHFHLEPPEDRIKEFTKKDLLEMPLSSSGTRPATVFFSSSRPMTQGSMARPSTNYQSLRLVNNVDMHSRGPSRGGLASAQSQFQEGERLRSPGVINTSPWNYTGSFAFFQSQKQNTGKPSQLPLQFQQFQSLKAVKIESKGSMGKYGDDEVEGDENDEIQQEDQQEGVVEQSEQMRRTFNGPGILQPSRKAFNTDINTEMSYAPGVRPQGDSKSTFINYNPSDEKGEIRLENMWYLNRNKAVQEKREHEELENHIQTWATNKGLVDQEIDKKNELTAHGSKFKDIGYPVQASIPKPELSDHNYEQKETTLEEVEDQALFNNYINIIKMSKEEKQLMAHPSANDESIYEIASKIDQSIRTPRSQKSMSRNFNDYQEQILDQSFDQSQSSNKAKKRPYAKKSSEIQPENHQIINERPKTMYVNLREQIKVKQVEDNPLIGIEQSMKKNKLANLRLSKGKIIGQMSAKPGEEADEEEITRRKQQSLQIYHRNGHSKSMYRPFTTMYKRISQENQRSEQLNEISKVRNGFAKKGIKCSMKTISQSLSRPQGLPLTELQLPTPGSMLFTNPFNQFTKKKKSKKSS